MKLYGMLLASSDPDRRAAWYVSALQPDDDSKVDQYRVLSCGGFYVLIDRRDDVAQANPEPGRMILNFDVADVRAAVARLDEVGAQWLAPLEDRDGSVFATVVDRTATICSSSSSATPSVPRWRCVDLWLLRRRAGNAARGERHHLEPRRDNRGGADAEPRVSVGGRTWTSSARCISGRW